MIKWVKSHKKECMFWLCTVVMGYTISLMTPMNGPPPHDPCGFGGFMFVLSVGIIARTVMMFNKMDMS